MMETNITEIINLSHEKGNLIYTHFHIVGNECVRPK